MSARQHRQQLAQRESRPTRAPRPSPRFALKISLGVHALLLLALFRAYTQYAGEPEPLLRVAVRASGHRSAATPSFVASPPSTVEHPAVTIRPTARVASLPHRTASLAETALGPIGQAARSAGRPTAAAVLPPIPVIVPTVQYVAPPKDVASIAALSDPAPLERTDTLRYLPLRIASRPIYGPRERTPIGLAKLPEARNTTRMRHPAAAFAHRRLDARTPPESRSAIDRGLEFLVRTQLDDGRWQFKNLRGTVDAGAETPSVRADVAATGLALLAFLGAGHDHFDGRYRYVAQDGLDFLTRTQQSHGEFFPEDGRPGQQLARFYSHGIATLALSEAYGMTGDAKLRGPAQAALDYLVGVHHRQPGAWRYLPGIDADAATIGWQLATLRSGKLAGLTVSAGTLAQIRAFIDQRRRRESQSRDEATTAVGLAVDLHLGAAPGSDQFRPAAERLRAHPPRVDNPPSAAADQSATADVPQRDTYYWYFGSEAMYYLGGDDWQTWSRELYPQLIESQVVEGPLAGSWNPTPTVASESFASAGRLYVTAMNLLSLEIRNRRLPPAGGEGVPQVAGRPSE